MHRRKSPLSINLATFVLAIVLSSAPTLRAEVNARQDANTVILSNQKVELKFDTNKRSFSIKNTATGEVVLDGARMSANGSESRKKTGKVGRPARGPKRWKTHSEKGEGLSCH